MGQIKFFFAVIEEIAAEEIEDCESIGDIEGVWNDIVSSIVNFCVVKENGQHTESAQSVYPVLSFHFMKDNDYYR